MLAVMLPNRYRDQQMGDLSEGFAARVHDLGSRGARRWYRSQVFRSLLPALMLRMHCTLHGSREGNGAVDALFQDLRYGLRTLRKSPSFAVVSILTLALAIGVNTAIFSLVTPTVFPDLPWEDPETMVVTRMVNPAQGVERAGLSYPDYRDLREQSQSFEELAALTNAEWVLTGEDEPTRVTGSLVSANFLRAWQRTTVLGRGFTEHEELPSAPNVVLLSHGFWVRRYAADPEVVGTSIRLDGAEYTVIGVTEPRLEPSVLFADREILMPLRMEREGPREDRRLYVSGRLKAGISVAQARDELDRLGSQLRQRHPVAHQGWSITVAGSKDDMLDDDSHLIIVMMCVTVVFVLLIACANVANMLLARATTRWREMAVRTAIGARRGRLVGQLLIECLLIAFAGSALGLGIARGLLFALVMITRGAEEAFLLAELDQRVLLFTLVVALVTPLVFGLVPAMGASRADLVGALRDRRSSSGGGRLGSRLRGFLVGTQVALAVMLMVVSGLFVRTVAVLVKVETGMRTEDLLTLPTTLPEGGYEEEGSIVSFYEDLRGALKAIPGIEAATLVSDVPSVGRGVMRALHVERRVTADEDRAPQVRVFRTSSDYLAVAGVPLIRGRGFTTLDTDESRRVALMSEEAVRRLFPHADPLGQRVRFAEEDEADWVEIVGVVGDVMTSLGEDEGQDPQVYLPFAQAPARNMVVVMRILEDPESLGGAIRSAVHAADPELPVDDLQTVEWWRYREMSTSYALLTLFVTFAGCALLMASIGIYGIASYSVEQRMSEFGIRLALGAEPGAVLGMVLRQGATMLALGTIVGLAGAYLLGQVVASLLFGVSATDPLTFIGVGFTLGTVALVASYVPAHRATRVDPMSVLREE